MGKRGARGRMKKLTKAQRSAIARYAARVRWSRRKRPAKGPGTKNAA